MGLVFYLWVFIMCNLNKFLNLFMISLVYILYFIIFFINKEKLWYYRNIYIKIISKMMIENNICSFFEFVLMS